MKSLAILIAVFSGLLSLVETHRNDDGGIEHLLDCAAELRGLQKLELETKAKLAAAVSSGTATSETQTPAAQLSSGGGWIFRSTRAAI